MNAPARQLLWVLPEGQRKMEMEKDTKIPNAANFIIHKEDHTIGNLLRMQLLRDETVYFAGYKLPHPLVQDMIVKVQTRDAPASPTEAMRTAIKDLQDEFSTFEELFNEGVKAFKAKQQEGQMFD